jgi:dolichol-phosphate mannosyltransferase
MISATVNFLINRKYVFGERGRLGKSFIKYVALCAVIMLLSAGGTWLLSSIGMSSTIAKLLTDAALYFASYRFQERWVFREDAVNE